MAKNYVDFRDAVALVFENAKENSLSENVTLDMAYGRVLAEDIKCVKNLPSFNNSAMDGFAIKASDAGKELVVLKSVYAGERHEASLAEGECYKIMTGAQVPSDVDTIIPIENVESFKDNRVKIPATVKKGDALRLKGEECELGATLFSKGEEVTPSVIAVLASQGIMNIQVKRPLSIAVVSTGNELKEPWEVASEDEIYNCNSFAVISILKEKGFEASYIKVIPDNLEDTVAFISELKSYDIIITSGGISMGDADFVGRGFEANGLETLFDGVNIKPGRPIMMGKMDKTFVICLPGNPLTAMVNLYLFVIPALRKIQGHKNYHHNVELAKNSTDFKTKSGRVNVVLGTLQEGAFSATRGNRYGSGMVSVMHESNAMLITDESSSLFNELDSLKIIKLDGDYLSEEIVIFN